MGAFKPLLRLGESTVLETAVGLCRLAGVNEVVVVLGHRAEELAPMVAAAGGRAVVHRDFDRGMFTSIRAGVAALAADVEACFILPVDIPLVRPSTLRAMAAWFARDTARVVYPVFGGRRGHPPLVARALLEEALAADAAGPLSALLGAHEHEARDLPVIDEAIHMDMDVEADYAALEKLAACRDVPSRAECEAILASVEARADLVEHARAVARLALRMASALMERGDVFDLRLLEAGALLHDVAKGRRQHAQAGAALVASLGFPRVAAIVAVHMDLDFSRRQMDEAALVFLADKLTRGAGPVSLEERFQPVMLRCQHDVEVLASAERRLATARAVAEVVEARLERPVGAFLEQA
jgi:molybdenum cofactor cytidylyltransferase